MFVSIKDEFYNVENILKITKLVFPRPGQTDEGEWWFKILMRNDFTETFTFDDEWDAKSAYSELMRKFGLDIEFKQGELK